MKEQGIKPGMKERELRDFATCRRCHRKIGELKLPIFWKVSAERHGLDMKASHRQTGLAMAMGSASLAQFMGPDEDMTVCLAESTIMICDECMIEQLPEVLSSDD